ncbi:MAG: pantoate--beta-alanine ligase [Candidatus Kapabacteria bacterium]|nr:pantoate--beta-alanine ligase [Candidatus Kapabacteria bacterium]
MKIIATIAEMQKASADERALGKRIALVPTMGYLHDGHVSLIKKAKDHADIVIASIFVNPTQFGPNEDFERYPRDFTRDHSLLEGAGCDYIFYPGIKEMYAGANRTEIKIDYLTRNFEGTLRPGHFNGVALVVSKLFNATLPHLAIFGQKDYQQTLVIKQMVRDLNFGIELIISATYREADGLAMSSRNVYLSPSERLKANIIFNALEKAKKAILSGERQRKIINATMHSVLRSVPEIRIDYASSALADSLDEPDIFLAGDELVLLLAVYLGRTRLIDNTLVRAPLSSASAEDKFVEEYI